MRYLVAALIAIVGAGCVQQGGVSDDRDTGVKVDAGEADGSDVGADAGGREPCTIGDVENGECGLDEGRRQTILDAQERAIEKNRDRDQPTDFAMCPVDDQSKVSHRFDDDETGYQCIWMVVTRDVDGVYRRDLRNGSVTVKCNCYG